MKGIKGAVFTALCCASTLCAASCSKTESPTMVTAPISAREGLQFSLSPRRRGHRGMHTLRHRGCEELQERLHYFIILYMKAFHFNQTRELASTFGLTLLPSHFLPLLFVQGLTCRNRVHTILLSLFSNESWDNWFWSSSSLTSSSSKFGKRCPFLPERWIGEASWHFLALSGSLQSLFPGKIRIIVN